MIHQLHAFSYMAFFPVWLDQHMEEVLVPSPVCSKAQAKNLREAPGEFPHNMQVCIFPQNNMKMSTHKSVLQSSHHIGIEALPLHVDKVFFPSQKLYMNKFFYADRL